MRRYIGLIPASTSNTDLIEAKLAAQRICETLSEWSKTFEDEGLLVLQPRTSAGGQSQSYLLDDGGGIVIGNLFRRQPDHADGECEVSLGGRWSQEIVKSAGRRLVQEFWGRYVAFVRSENRNSTFVLRDPSGGSFCFGAKVGGVHVYFSHLTDVVRALDIALSVNWDFVLESFLVSEFHAGPTGFREIGEIVPGGCHEIGANGFVQSLYWDPCKIWGDGVFTDVGTAADAVRNTTQSCVDAWASTCDSVIHNLSGGLDSAIVLACFSKSRHQSRILCINFYGETPDSDERFFAQRAAEVYGCELAAFETPCIGRSLDKLILENQIWPHPTLDFFGIPAGRIKGRLAHERSADVFTSGQGGDHVFCKIGSSLIAADYAFMHGLDRHLLKICYETARMLRVSFWSVLGTAISFGLLRRSVELRKHTNPIPSSAVLGSAANERLKKNFMHPWMENAHRLPNAKKLQISELCKAVNRYPSFGISEVADVIHPLLSQPVMEACIRTPAYMACLDSRDRGLARRAFSEGMPREILYRKSKGSTSTRYTRMFVDNIDYLREFILDGILVRQPFMDTRCIEGMLTVTGIENIENLMQIIKLVATESWLRDSDESKPRLAYELSERWHVA